LGEASLAFHDARTYTRPAVKNPSLISVSLGV
jgi:hypothetical protein